MQNNIDIHAPVPSWARMFANDCVRPHARDAYHPKQIHQLESFQSHRLTQVDVACKEKASASYSGDDRLRQSVELKFGDFLDHYQAAFQGQSHWLASIDDLDFCLCQCPIVAFGEGAPKSQLPRVMEDFMIPKCLENEAMAQVNLWMTIGRSRTTIHYDAYNNILVVLYGKKTVTLYPPADTRKLDAHPIYSKSANHSRIKLDHSDDVNQPHFANLKVDVCAGDALFIPEGWWHQVDSDVHTIAVNYWFHGLRPNLIASPAMFPYYARILMSEMIKMEASAYLAELRDAQRTQRLHQDTTAATSAFVSADSQLERERLCWCMSADDLTQLQLAVAQQHPRVWTSFLSDASVDFVAFITTHWEQQDTDSEFLTCIFDPLGDNADVIRNAFVERNEAFQQRIFHRVLLATYGNLPSVANDSSS
ncbi:TPA: hypothetical protein N0F65_011584 [Lagenidium giganteum]|uniref:JmjC domain-containing protein n=1 Tax=Lagenidium giganteum TaxID=4803 RepID=A0AAV2ZBA6_9STRA|nr:TPA: hypothetical protein N0F65_011584 [Lagenidium giganteum]